MLTGISDTSSLGALERMEEKVLQIESQSEAMNLLGSDDLEQKIASLNADQDIDTELTAMKTYILEQGQNYQANHELPPHPPS
jgi:phage shock protein A